MEEKFISSLKEVLEIGDREIQLTDKFRDYPEWDSLGRLSLIALLDSDYGVQIEAEAFKKLETVGDLLNEVKKHAK